MSLDSCHLVFLLVVICGYFCSAIFNPSILPSDHCLLITHHLPYPCYLRVFQVFYVFFTEGSPVFLL